MPRIYPDPVRPKPLPMDASSRFWCGAVCGAVVRLLIGLVLSIAFFLDTPSLFILCITFCIVLCGGLAVRYGEDFWYWIRDVLRALQPL